MRHRTIRRNLHFSVSLWPIPLASTRRERGRENIAVGVRVSRGRTPCASLCFSSARHLRSTAADYTGGCPAIVTLALLIACPTKVYHYHRHPSCPPSALNPLVSRCTYCSVFLSLRRRSLPYPPPPITPRGLVSPADPSLSPSLYILRAALHHHPGHTLTSRVRLVCGITRRGSCVPLYSSYSRLF